MAASTSANSSPYTAITTRKVWCVEENCGLAFPEQVEDPDYQSLYQSWSNKNKIKIAKQRPRWISLLNKGWLNKPLNRNDSTVKKLTRKGIPSEFRGKVWFHLSGASAKKKAQPDYYRKLVEENQGKTSRATADIEKDITRTFPEHPFYNSQEGQDILRRCLHAYSWHNTRIGYCQSMNFVLAMLLLHMEEEDAFWTFLCIMDDYLPEDLYHPSLDGLHCEIYVLEQLIKERLPKMYNHMQRLRMEAAFFSTSWFLCLFVTSFPVETALRIWDSFFVEGYKILFRVGVAFFKMHEAAFLANEDLGSLIMNIKQRTSHLFDCRTLIKTSFAIRRFSKDHLQVLRGHGRVVRSAHVKEQNEARAAAEARIAARRQQQQQQQQEAESSTAVSNGTAA